MAARRALAAALAGASACLLVASCATAVTGTPQAGTTLPAVTGSTGRTPIVSTQHITTPATASSTDAAPTTSSHPVTSPTASSGPTFSTIRPMPPLTTTRQTTAGSTKTSTATSTSHSAAGTVAGIDLDRLLDKLDASHVAGVNSKADLGKVRSLVHAARTKGLQLSVVSIGKKIDDDDTSVIARRLFDRTGGTLLVLSPTLVSARSDQLTDAQRKAAIKAAAHGSGDEQAVQEFITSALRATGSAGGTTRMSPTRTSHPKVGGVDIDAVVSALGSDHIAIAKGVTEVNAKDLSKPVQRAWHAHLKVYVSILAKDPTGHLYDVASAVMKQTGGTVIMATPQRYALASDAISDRDLQDALDAGADASSYRELVEDMIDTLLK